MADSFDGMLELNGQGTIKLVQKIADDWNVLVIVPSEELAVQVRARGRVRAFINGEAEESGSNIPSAEEELVFGDFNRNWGVAFPAAWDAGRKHLPPGLVQAASLHRAPRCDVRDNACKQGVATFCKIDPKECRGTAPPPTARHDIQASCNIEADGSKAHFWSFNPRRERGHFIIHCQNGFKDEMDVAGGEFARTAAADPGHYRSDG